MGSSPNVPVSPSKPLSCRLIHDEDVKPRYRIRVAGKVVTNERYDWTEVAYRDGKIRSRKTAPKRARSRRGEP